MAVEVAVAPGDVLTVRMTGWFAGLIRFGAAVRGKPNLDAHVAVVHHTDAAGTVWCIEGRPGGVGWADASAYLAVPYTFSNAAQPKTDEQRATVTAVVEQMLKTGYDWDAIAQDALSDLGVRTLWEEKWNGKAPGQVVCSSLASWAYLKAQLRAPQGADPRHIQPADWLQFILTQGWAAPVNAD